MKWKRDKEKIVELYEKYRKGELQLQPFFQRNLVWTKKAKSQFIESILLNLPISEVYLYEDESGRLSVIDGQQRLSTIFHFIDSKFSLEGLEKLYQLNGKNIDFDKKIAFENSYIYYVKMDKTVSREEIIDTYSRINRYTVNLNAQELRRAAYNGSDFLQLSEELAQLEFFQIGRFFTERKRERMNDVEFISELIAFQLEGVQDKKNKLDDFYIKYTTFKDYDLIQSDFIHIVKEIESFFNFSVYFVNDKKKYNGYNAAKNLGLTRFRQQADFYTLFMFIKNISDESITLTPSDKEKFLKLLLIYDYLIAPESDIDILSTYAVKCVSQGNTKNSRIFRYGFLRESLTFVLTKIESDTIKEMKEELYEIFDFTLDMDAIDLDSFYSIVDSFYEETEEDD
jgi:uncharacterized protein with ParB-like and HNH nuclease domain